MRTLSKEFMDAASIGHLKPLLDRVRTDPDLELFIREGYINIYYKGASILKLTESPSSRFEVEIDTAYLAPADAYRKLGLVPLPPVLNDPSQVGDFLLWIPLLKEGVVAKARHVKRELESEQLFIRINNRLGRSGVNSDYFVLDRQYAEVGKRESRMDMLGIRWRSGCRKSGDVVPPVLIEAKYGLNSDIQEVADQLRRYVDHFREAGEWRKLVCKMQVMLRQRAALGLFGPKYSEELGSLKIDPEWKHAEILILLVDYNRRSDLYRRAEAELARLAAERGLNIRVAHVGMALWESERHERSSALKKQLYAHLTAVKAREITPAPGSPKNRATHPLILPLEVRDKLPHIYEPIRDLVGKLSFKRHKFFYHMASSQAACLNLFIPILAHPKADEVLRAVLPDIQLIDREWLGRGFAFEYSGEELALPGGPLGDKSASAGTDCDLAVAYINGEGKRCLWLVEHKLTEQEFTTCGGYRSKGRDETRHRCDSSFAEILAEPSRCFYTDEKKYRYWDVVRANEASFRVGKEPGCCPFKGGMNQLWRNQLLAWAIEEKPDFDRVTFAVVHHPKNTDVLPTIQEFQSLTHPSIGFFAFDSARLVVAASQTSERDLQAWADWYRERYLPDGSRP